MSDKDESEGRDRGEATRRVRPRPWAEALRRGGEAGVEEGKDDASPFLLNQRANGSPPPPPPPPSLPDAPFLGPVRSLRPAEAAGAEAFFRRLAGEDAGEAAGEGEEEERAAFPSRGGKAKVIW